MSVTVVQLRRTDNSQPWGMRLKGGVDQGIPLHIEHVQPKGRAASVGLIPGDYVLAICGNSTGMMTHAQVKSEMLRAGNDLDITIQRDPAMMAQAPLPQPQQQQHRQPEEPRVVIDDTPLPRLGGPMYKEVKPKTYQVLEGQLGQEEANNNPAAEAHVKPASIFDRRREERSDYLKARGSSYQKAFGE